MTDAGRRGTVIVGAGLMGTWHAHALKAAGLAVVAVVDTDLARAKQLAKRCRAAASERLADALEHRPFAVHVCTPPDSHLEVLSASLDAGAHCLVEKPFAPDAATARRMLELAEQRTLLACPVHQFLFQRGIERVHRAVMEFGPLLHADFVACSAGAIAGGDSPERRARLALDILPHPLSLLRRLLGRPLDVSDWAVAIPAPGEVRVAGIAGTVSVGILLSATGRPTRNTARFIGEHGTMHVDLFHGFATFESPRVSRIRKITRPFSASAATLAGAAANLAVRLARREPAYPGLRELVTAFYAAAEVGKPGPITPAETIDVADAGDRLAARITAAR